MGEPTIRRLHAGDEDVIRRLADDEPRTALLADPAMIFLVAFDGEEPVGFVFGYELEVHEAHRRRGIAARLLRDLLRRAQDDGIIDAFVLTEPDNDAANALYASLGGRRSTAHMYEWSPAS